MPPCVPHSGRHPDHAGGRRQDRRGLKPEPPDHPANAPDEVRFPDPETTLSVTLTTDAAVLSSAGSGVTSPQPFARSWVLRDRGANERYLVMYQSYGISIACNEVGCR